MLALVFTACLLGSYQLPLWMVPNSEPNAQLSATSEVLVSETVHLDGSQWSDPDGYAFTYSWHLGDGATASVVAVEHVYATVGEYTVVLTVTDLAGLSNSDTLILRVSDRTVNHSPVAQAGDDQSVEEGAPVHFDGSASSDPDVDKLSYRWELGDGNSHNGQIAHSQPLAANLKAYAAWWLFVQIDENLD